MWVQTEWPGQLTLPWGREGGAGVREVPRWAEAVRRGALCFGAAPRACDDDLGCVGEPGGLHWGSLLHLPASALPGTGGVSAGVAAGSCYSKPGETEPPARQGGCKPGGLQCSEEGHLHPLLGCASGGRRRGVASCPRVAPALGIPVAQGEESVCSAGAPGSPLGWDIPWGRAWQPLQCPCLEKPMDRGS